MDVHPDNIQHVVPINDTGRHITKCDFDVVNEMPICLCKCKPKHEVVGEGVVVVHNSFDGREGVEWANEILNK